MFGCGKKTPKEFETRFMTYCVKGLEKSEIQLLDQLWMEAKSQDLQDQIIEATDDQGDLPIHKAANFGHWQILEWIFNKEELNATSKVNEPDSQGYTPLFLACFKGYMGAEAIMSKSQQTKDDRFECVSLLLSKGAEPNIAVDKVHMTPLHWACYNDDADVVWLLLNEMKSRGQAPVKSSSNFFPIDVAGFMKSKQAIMAFITFAEMLIE